MSSVSSAKARLFDHWAPTYDWLIPSVFYQAIHQRLLEFVQLSDEPVVLDIGCGTGRLLNRLAAQFPSLKGFGLDLSEEMIRLARQRNHHRPRLIFVQGKSDNIRFADGQFEAVFSTMSFLHYPQPLPVMQEISRVLKPNGRFYLADYIPPGTTGTQWFPVSPGGLQFYSRAAREQLGHQANFGRFEHHYLLGPVVLTIFFKQAF